MRYHRIFIALLLASSALWAQEDKRALDDKNLLATAAVVPLPSTINGDFLLAEVVPETERRREWGTNLTLTTICNDNLQGTATNALSDCSLGLQPGIFYRQTGSRSSWNLNYMSSFTGYRRYSDLNEMDQVFGADIEHRFTRRLTVRVREAFLKTSNFLNGLPSTGNVPAFGLMQRPNQVVLTPATREISTTSGLEAKYQLSETAVAALSATYSDLQYTNVNQINTGLERTRTGNVTGTYSHRVGTRNWMGFSYGFANMRFGGTDWLVTHSILYTHTLQISPKLSIDGFVGPEYAGSHGQTAPPSSLPALFTCWTTAAGATLGWATKFNTITGSVVHRQSDSAGLYGAATITDISAGFTRQLSAKFKGSLNGAYGETTPLGLGIVTVPVVIGYTGRLHTTTLLMNIDYTIRQHWILRAFYARDWQKNLDLTVNDQFTRNRAGISFNYEFVRPLGR